MKRTVALSAAAILLALSATASGSGETSMYANDSPADRQVKEQIEDIYGIYILLPSRRHSRERVEVNGDTVEMSLFIDPIKPDYDKVKCDAFKWLLLGRFPSANTGGAQPFFAQFKQFNSVELRLYKLDSKRSVEPDGRYKVAKEPDYFLKESVTRRHAERLDWASVKSTLEPKERPKDPTKFAEACVRAGEKMVDRTWYKPEYFK